MKIILTEDATLRTLKRMTHEIIEKFPSLEDVVLVGILKKGYPIAVKIQEFLHEFSGHSVPVFPLDIQPFRDDTLTKDIPTVALETQHKKIILLDDVLYTGRSVRAAMDALMIPGRPDSISLGILIDRGHRELPIRPDFIGKNIPTSHQEKIIVDPELFTVALES